MIKREELFQIGKFQKTHALKGELNMISDLPVEYFEEGHPMIVEYDGIFVPYFINSIRPKGSTTFLVKIDGIESEEEASQFVNKEIYVLKNEAEEWLDEDLTDSSEFEDYEIIDSSTGFAIGKIEYVDDSTSNILFVAKNKYGEEIIVPATEDFIEEIDDERKIIKMNLPEGLLSINERN